MIEPDGGSFSYNYDANGRMDHLVKPEGERTTWTYDASGREWLKLLAVNTADTTMDYASLFE